MDKVKLKPLNIFKTEAECGIWLLVPIVDNCKKSKLVIVKDN